jgi:hypothetical protein
MMTRVEKIKNIDQKCLELFERKNKEYGNTIVETGVLGASVELIGGVARLKQLVLRNPTHGADKDAELINVLMDLHNYSNIALMMLQENNFSGAENE